MTGANPGEQAVQLRDLTRAEVCEGFILDRGDGRFDCRHRRGSDRGDLDDVATAIGRVTATFDPPVAFEVIQNSDQCAGIDGQDLDQALLARGAGLGEPEEGRGVTRAQTGDTERLS